MNIRLPDLALPVLVAGIGVVLLAYWLNTQPDALSTRVPGMDHPDGGVGPAVASRELPAPGQPVRSGGVPAELSGEWPWFRGLHWNAVATDGPPLARTWPPEGPPVLWTVPLGEGYASAAVWGGRVFVLDYDAAAQADTMRCLSLDDGQEIWRNSYPVLITRNHGMSRTVPAVVGDCVISFGPQCHIACWEIETGRCRWILDLVAEYGAEVPRWYAGQCPLVDGERLILAPSGKAMLVALDWSTGGVVWESPNPHRWRMTHSSVMPMEYGGRRMYIYCGSGGVAGVDAESGQLLWESTEWQEHFATSPSPVVLPDGRIFLCSGYDNATGSLMLKLQKDADRIVAEVAFRLSPKTFNSEQQTPIFIDGHLFGVRKRGGGRLVCLDLDGNELWNSGGDRFGHGPYLVADGLIYVMDNHGQLVMTEATTSGYKALGRSQVFEDGRDAWGPMALVAGRLIVRDMTRMACLDVAAAANSP